MHLLLVEGAFSLCHPCIEVSMTDARISVQLSECVAPELALIANISLARIVTFCYNLFRSAHNSISRNFIRSRLRIHKLSFTLNFLPILKHSPLSNHQNSVPSSNIATARIPYSLTMSNDLKSMTASFNTPIILLNILYLFINNIHTP